MVEYITTQLIQVSKFELIIIGFNDYSFRGLVCKSLPLCINKYSFRVGCYLVFVDGVSEVVQSDVCGNNNAWLVSFYFCGNSNLSGKIKKIRFCCRGFGVCLYVPCA
jgi:hypothetical protein